MCDKITFCVSHCGYGTGFLGIGLSKHEYALWKI